LNTSNTFRKGHDFENGRWASRCSKLCHLEGKDVNDVLDHVDDKVAAPTDAALLVA
jgi:hypothetical protein